VWPAERCPDPPITDVFTAVGARAGRILGVSCTSRSYQLTAALWMRRIGSVAFDAYKGRSARQNWPPAAACGTTSSTGGRHTGAWHERDESWLTMAPLMFPAKQVEEAAAEIDKIVPLLGLTQPAPVLDLCCGPGRHSLELARRGYAVEGVDRTRLTSNARQRARRPKVSTGSMRRTCAWFVAPVHSRRAAISV
jgi:hypothetical protein